MWLFVVGGDECFQGELFRTQKLLSISVSASIERNKWRSLMSLIFYQIGILSELIIIKDIIYFDKL